MAVALVRTAEAVDAKTALCEYMQERIDAGDDTKAAGTAVVARLQAEGLWDAVIDMFAARLVYDVWRSTAAGPAPGRNELFRKITSKEDSSGGVPEGGRRRVDLTLLSEDASALETLWHVHDEWVRLGDMVKWQLRTLADRYVQLADNAKHKGEFFDRLATDIPKDKCVRAVFSEQQVLAIVEELGA